MDCIEGMKQIPDSSVQLVFYSPPYNCGMDYDSHEDNLDYTDYYWWMVNVLRQADRILVDGGRIAINIPMVIKFKSDNKVHNMHDIFYDGAVRVVGLEFRDIIIWAKGHDLKAVNRYHTTNWGTYLSPKNPSTRSFCEYIIVFCKGSRALDGNGKLSDLTPSEWPLLTGNLWLFQGQTHKEHPAVFPAELAKRVIKLFTYVGDIVVDPFAGIGTTLVQARKLNREFIGFEISKRYCHLAQRELSKTLTLNSVLEKKQEKKQEKLW